MAFQWNLNWLHCKRGLLRILKHGWMTILQETLRTSNLARISKWTQNYFTSAKTSRGYKSVLHLHSCFDQKLFEIFLVGLIRCVVLLEIGKCILPQCQGPGFTTRPPYQALSIERSPRPSQFEVFHVFSPLFGRSQKNSGDDCTFFGPSGLNGSSQSATSSGWRSSASKSCVLFSSYLPFTHCEKPSQYADAASWFYGQEKPEVPAMNIMNIISLNQLYI